MTFSRKEGHPNIHPLTRPGIGLGTSGLGGRDLNHCAKPSAIEYIPFKIIYSIYNIIALRFFGLRSYQTSKIIVFFMRSDWFPIYIGIS